MVTRKMTNYKKSLYLILPLVIIAVLISSIFLLMKQPSAFLAAEDSQPRVTPQSTVQPVQTSPSPLPKPSPKVQTSPKASPLAAAQNIPQPKPPAPPPTTPPPPAQNTPPASGYSRQHVRTDSGTFTVDIIAADLNSTRVIVDTASDSDCANNCPVLPLGEYAVRSGAYAGINGSYFCPASYSGCAGKTNSFDTLLMNKNKRYLNSDNNVYSTVPAVIFSGNTARFVNRSLEWGRDTGVDAVIANYPLLLANSEIVFNGSGDPKHNSKGPRCFIGINGSTVYIGIVQNATMADSAKVLKTLGLTHALNLDEGGSTALWSGGKYIAGPGRNIPNAVLFVRK